MREWLVATVAAVTVVAAVSGAFEDGALVVADSSALCAGTKEGAVCDPIRAKVCQNGSCDSVCGLRSLAPCSCPSQADRECYRCCGNANNACRPAHSYSVFKPNGERWEKASCSVCRDMEDGLPCDDKDPSKLCKNGRCTSDLCGGLREGEICDRSQTKICVDHKCIQPCPAGQMLCDCDLAYRSLEVSADRCQLCCYDFSARQCRNAFKSHGITDGSRRPIPRTGLACARGKTCDRFGACVKGGGERRLVDVGLMVSLLVICLPLR